MLASRMRKTVRFRKISLRKGNRGCPWVCKSTEVVVIELDDEFPSEVKAIIDYDAKKDIPIGTGDELAFRSGLVMSFHHLTKKDIQKRDTSEEGEEIARAFIMWMIVHVFFANYSSTVHSGWLSALIDLRFVGSYDWGESILARIDRSLDKCSRCIENFSGMWFLLEGPPTYMASTSTVTPPYVPEFPMQSPGSAECKTTLVVEVLTEPHRRKARAVLMLNKKKNKELRDDLVAHTWMRFGLGLIEDEDEEEEEVGVVQAEGDAQEEGGAQHEE
ncbi:Aminotransferase-like [Macleaya cordata]|uniref:Aminotransferase-like n=1 Tax=Macleaya cordata TaxID=56857 RepID=A0A200Q309_MACCD|nr:Aminotransferase-like [Macleaya cordata]